MFQSTFFTDDLSNRTSKKGLTFTEEILFETFSEEIFFCLKLLVMRFEGGICRWFAGRNDFEDSMTDGSISTCFLSVCLSICLSVCLYVFLSVFLSVYLSVCLSVCLSICLVVGLYVSHSAYYKLIINDFFLYVSLSLHMSLCLSVPLSLCFSRVCTYHFIFTKFCRIQLFSF
jgi:hypothetical protein